MTAKVFAVQEVPHINYSDAERFGELYFLSKHDVMGHRTNGSLNDEIIARVQVMLDGGFNPESDYILLCGDPVLIGISVHQALTRAGVHGKITVLKFDKIRGGYSPIELKAH